MKAKNEQKSKLTLRAGSYSLGLCILAVAIVVALNVLLGLLPGSITTPDLSSSQLYDFTEQTRTMAERLSEPVTVYHWIDTGNSNYNTIAEFAERFAALSPNITVKTVSPDRDPTFIERFVKEGESEPNRNSLIFESEKRYRIVDYTSMFTWSQNAYTYALQYYYQNPNATLDQIQSVVPYDVFSAENAAVNALDYVTTNKLPVLYLLRGHGEAVLGNTATAYADRENYSVVPMEGEKSLVALEAVPEDANCVIINKPTSDLTEDEYGKLMQYMERGGSIVFLTDQAYSAETCPTFARLCEAYGLKQVKGVVMETAGNYSGYPFNLIANKVNHTITAPIIEGGYTVYAPLAHGIVPLDSYRSSLKIQTLLQTSDGAYAKIITDDTSTYDKEEGDTDGGFLLGVLVEEEVAEGAASRFFWFSSRMVDDEYVGSNVGGLNLFLNSLAYGTERSDTITVRAIQMTNTRLDISARDGTLWWVVLGIVIPVLLLVLGFVIWFARRRRK